MKICKNCNLQNEDDGATVCPGCGIPYDDENKDLKEEKDKKPEKNETVGNKVLKEMFNIVEVVAVALAVVMLTFSFVAMQARVDGDSMRETFHDGEPLVISNLFYTPKTGDVVVFQIPESALASMSGVSYNLTEPLIKRVIAVGGQTVYIDYQNWKVYVYDDPKLTVDEVVSTVEPLDEPYIEEMRKHYNSAYPMTNFGLENPYTVEEGKVFCMGDNRNNSLDCRAFGAIDQRYILGKVLFRIWPLTFEF